MTPQIYDVYREGELIATLMANQVETLCLLDPDELAWALDECGRCDIDDQERAPLTLWSTATRLLDSRSATDVKLQCRATLEMRRQR